jgi:hypothetical protein
LTICGCVSNAVYCAVLSSGFRPLHSKLARVGSSGSTPAGRSGLLPELKYAMSVSSA